ncbi:protein of unknown function [Taphrina deformans PYCC 5710]|uniref:Zn(2)-C6 fungal-type domain-containing protein n=1 Tax=Taphrina deformans (strain PYCC 5710 / ATCC 11124 / CBS 356.35 / IMI 108563 / JCM 9778 / NBRC 8474) TaxID=1097556 RepID=R4XP33_TAPDE|nr:protein of unknown function [Taphrina deformans PYCC 5710]|eukprot:CCG85015.1 protein of unknown function [Taphrina deformans PYCC 5710]
MYATQTAVKIASRVKCDRAKPICGCCVRKHENCNYSKIQFNTINKRTHDKRTGRKTKLKIAQDVLEARASRSLPTQSATPKESINTRERGADQLFEVIFENPGKLSSQDCKPRQLPTPVSSPGPSDADMTHRHSDIHKLLWPDISPTLSTSSIDAQTSRTSLISLHEKSSENEYKCEEHEIVILPDYRMQGMQWCGLGSFADEEYAVPDSSNDLIDVVRESSPTKTRWSPVPDCPRPRNDFSDIASYASPEVMEIMKFRNSRVLIHYYLNRAVATIHPQQDIVDNTSAKLIMPYCLQYPVAMEAILAFSASQLVMEDPGQQQALLYHKMSSIKHLNRLVYQQAFAPQRHGVLTTYGLDLMVSVISQITLSVTESGTETWQMHCGAAYSMLAVLPKPLASECSKDLQAYIYCRLLKYICFAEIARPTDKELDLSLIEGQNLTVEFGVPSDGLKLAAMITRYTYQRGLASQTERLPSLLAEIGILLREYLSLEVFEPLSTLSDYMIMKSVWRTTVWLYYNRCVQQTTIEHDSSRIALSRIINYLRLLPIDSGFGTSLAFVLLTIMPLITKTDQGLRTWFLNTCKHLTQSTGTRNFLKIAEFSNLCWLEVDNGQCDTIAEVRRLADSTGHVILAA